MANKKLFNVLGQVWFTLRSDQIVGIVLMNNGYEDKAYIGMGKVEDKQADIDFILAWGKPFPVEAAKLIFTGKNDY